MKRHHLPILELKRSVMSANMTTTILLSESFFMIGTIAGFFPQFDDWISIRKERIRRGMN